MGGLERRKSLEEKVGFGGCGDGANWNQIGGATDRGRRIRCEIKQPLINQSEEGEQGAAQEARQGQLGGVELSPANQLPQREGQPGQGGTGAVPAG